MTLYHGSKDIVEYPEIRRARFKCPTHQISFHTISALDTLKFAGSEVIYGEKKIITIYFLHVA